MWDYRAEYLDNYDGDTVKVRLDLGFSINLLADIRLLGVYAPEVKEIGGPECKEFVHSWFISRVRSHTPWNFIVTTARMKVADREQKTFDRYVATITDLGGTANLNLDIMQFIIANGYSGGSGS